MKTRNILVLVLALLMIGWIASPALAAGPEDPGGCNVNYEPSDDDPIYKCEFTVTRDKSSCTEACINTGLDPHYNIVLNCKRKKKGNEKHVFSSLHEGPWINLETLTVEDLLDPTFGFGFLPCILDIEDAFGDVGVPVIDELKITATGNGDTTDEWMLGKIYVRVVQPISDP